MMEQVQEEALRPFVFDVADTPGHTNVELLGDAQEAERYHRRARPSDAGDGTWPGTGPAARMILYLDSMFVYESQAAIDPTCTWATGGRQGDLSPAMPLVPHSS